MRTVLLACVACAVACGGSSDRPPPSDPTTVTVTPSNATVPTDPTLANPPPAASQPMAPTPSADMTTATPAAPSTYAAAPASPDGTTTMAPSPSPATTPQSTTGVRDTSANDRTKSADNTAVNDRDRHGGTLTPMNQGNSADETKITAAVRRGLMGDKSLSFTAKNVKIITVGTKVTLRGPVNSDQEKAAIEQHAKQTPGVTDVDDQLEVKTKK